jgi:hypothetical protein
MPLLRIALVAALLCACAGNAWSQNTSRARAQFDELTRAVLTMAQELLRSQGEFPPFGAGLTASRDVVEVSKTEAAERDETRAGDTHVSLLRDSLAQGIASGRFEATALVYEAKMDLPSGKRSDAIAVALSHRDRNSTVRFFPYQLRGAKIELGKAQTMDRSEPRN